jgi:hypothetical protein
MARKREGAEHSTFTLEERDDRATREAEGPKGRLLFRLGLCHAHHFFRVKLCQLRHLRRTSDSVWLF